MCETASVKINTEVCENIIPYLAEDTKGNLNSNNALNESITVNTQEIDCHPSNTGELDVFLIKYRDSLLRSTDITERYHDSEITSASKIMRDIIRLMYITAITSFLSTLTLSILGILYGAITTAVFCSLLEGVLGYSIKVLNSTLRSKEKYFEREIEMAEYDKTIALLLTVKHEDKKVELISKVIESYLQLKSSIDSKTK